MPGHKRGPWSQHEDNYLLSLVNIHGPHNWVRISQAIQTRSPKQCRERFHQNLKPSLNHDPITPEEGLLIEQMVSEMGKRWAEIARRLRGRSDNAVKNWWNGGMNRRRRSQNTRRNEVDLHHQPHISAMHQGFLAPTHHQQPLPSNFPPNTMTQQFFQVPQAMPHMGQVPVHPLRVPSNGPPLRTHGLVETPLPSPSAFSQMSAEGPPSLISDSSSISARSPHNGASPIELPPLSGSRSERRQSSAPILQLGVPGSFVPDSDFQTQAMHMQRYVGDAEKHSRMLQEPFMPQHQQHTLYSHPSQYMQQPQYHPPRRPSPMQIAQTPMTQQYAIPQLPTQKPPPPQQLLPSQPVQLPSISNLSSSCGPTSDPQQFDPTLRQGCSTPAPSGMMSPGAVDDGSPKDKMSLSNLTT